MYAHLCATLVPTLDDCTLHPVHTSNHSSIKLTNCRQFVPVLQTRAWLVHSQAPFLLLGALYTLLFIQACQAGLFSQLAPFWQALTAQPLTHGSLFTSSTIDVAAVGHILGQPLFTLLAWVQLLMLDLLQAR